MKVTGALIIFVVMISILMLTGCSTPRQTSTPLSTTVSSSGTPSGSDVSATPEGIPSASPTDPTDDIEPDAVNTNNLDKPLVPQTSESPEKVEE